MILANYFVGKKTYNNSEKINYGKDYNKGDSGHLLSSCVCWSSSKYCEMKLNKNLSKAYMDNIIKSANVTQKI